MIIDSHVHYSHHLYEKEYYYIGHRDGNYSLARADRKGMLADINQCGITFCIEPSTRFSLIERQLEIVAEYNPFLRLALGVHPKYCNEAAWEDRKTLREYVLTNEIIAIGETGLDYSLKPPELNKVYQKMWFLYQIRLAHELNLPLILHTRDADRDVLKILKRQQVLLHGGVAHCFGGDYQTAIGYINLGFTLGIGGKLLDDSAEGLILQDTVARVPLESILVETDAPYQKPDLSIADSSKSQRNKARNTSLILPAVIEKIAQLRGEDRDTIEEAIYRNTLRVFRLNRK